MSLLSLYTITYIITGLIGLVLMVVVLHRNWNDRFSVLYALVNISLFIWATGRYLSLITANPDVALFWIRILYYGSILIYIFFLHSILTFIKVSDKRRPILLFFNSLAVILLVANTIDLIFGTTFLISDAGPKLLFPFYEIPGHIYFVQLFINIFIPLYALSELLVAYRHAEGSLRSQIKYIILSSVFGFVGGGTILLPVYGFNIQPFGIPFVALQFITITYAITRHRLFDLKIIATQVFTFTLWVFILIRTLLSDNPTDIITNASLLILAVVIGVFLIRSVMQEVKQREKIEKLAKELGRANERLKELDALKTEFISFATHQLRAPISAIRGYASEMLQGDFGSVPDNLKAPTEVIMQSSSSLAVLVDDYLNVSRIEQGKMKYEFSDFNLADLVNEVANEQRPNVEKKGLKLEVKMDGGAMINADRGKIKQVLMNLLDNSVKYTLAGAIAIALTKQDGQARLSVKDTGAGIKPETMAYLFKKFSRASDASKYNLFGTGLGLYLASELLKVHHGKIWAESEGEGKGSTFFVELPVM